MVAVLIHIPEDVPKEFLKLAQEVGLIQIIPVLDDTFASISKNVSCACPTSHKLAVCDQSMIIKKGCHEAMTFPGYGLPERCTREEALTILTWIIRFQFQMFRSTIRKSPSGPSLKRTLSSTGWFRVTDVPSCNQCLRYTRIGDPAFMLPSIVLSGYGKGPTIESVLQEEKDE